MENVRQFLGNDKFAQHVGIQLLDVSEGRAKAKLEITEQHFNGLNIVHGGAIFTLADLVFAAASNSHGTVAMGISVSISYMKAVRGGTLIAEAREVSLNSKLATYMVHVTDEHNDLIAIFQGTVYRKEDKIGYK